MPIHWNIEKFKLQEELRLLQRANQIVTHIIPDLIEHPPGLVYGNVVRYAIVFEDGPVPESVSMDP